MITLDELRVATPCTSAVWDTSEDERARLCKKCNKNVYNLSLMTLDEADNLIREKEGKLCITLYHGFNGKVLTADAPVALRAIRRKYLKARAKAIGLALAIWGFITGSTSSCNSIINGYNGLPTFQRDTNFSAGLTNADGSGGFWQPQSSAIVNGINDTTVNEILISGTSLNNGSMWIFIDSTELAPGTYENHRGVFPAGGYFDPTKQDSSFWYSGELKITSISSTHASGTFWFNARGHLSKTDTVSVTNGVFDVDINFGKIAH